VLESLGIEGVPRLIETNARHYDDPSFMLYAVSTYIPGRTLAELKPRYTAEEAIGWTVALCDILQKCREAGKGGSLVLLGAVVSEDEG
jgi:hypothetical protein